MKKILAAAILLTSSFAIPAAADPISSSAAAEPQIRVRVGQPGRRWGQRRVIVSTTSRITTIGRWRYREVIRVTRYPNGRVVRQVISRTRIGRAW